MNLLFIVFGIMLVVLMASGYENGMVRQFIAMVSMIVSGIVIALVVNGLKNYMDGQIANVVIMIVLLCIVAIASHLLSMVLAPVKLIAKLPIMKWLDKLLGIGFGAMETIFIIWIMYSFVMMMNLGMVGEQILEYTVQSKLLTWLYQNNYLAYCIEQYIL